MELPTGSIIASGPVIIEDNKVLLNQHGEDEFWKFPGGQVEDFTVSLEDSAKREVKEEMGIAIEIIRPLKPLLVQKPSGEVIVLIHFLAKRLGEITPGADIREWNWFAIDNLPDNLAPNIKPVLESL
ncbi:MAG: NUDIX domain-containing protein [Patescibacteria group bacterium]